MRAGVLRHRIEIKEKRKATDDGMGGETFTWLAVPGMESIPAAIWPLKSNERLESMKLELAVTHKIRIRYRSGVTANLQVAFDDRTFNIWRYCSKEMFWSRRDDSGPLP